MSWFGSTCGQENFSGLPKVQGYFFTFWTSNFWQNFHRLCKDSTQIMDPDEWLAKAVESTEMVFHVWSTRKYGRLCLIWGNICLNDCMPNKLNLGSFKWRTYLYGCPLYDDVSCTETMYKIRCIRTVDTIEYEFKCDNIMKLGLNSEPHLKCMKRIYKNIQFCYI